ncbi:MAG: hypothetical protein IT431_11800 [Phycisphaerales bacterium]|nr:hypothetical protein [Phycisphaerales bacterium]
MSTSRALSTPAAVGEGGPVPLGETETQIEGRFRPISVHQLALAWWLHTAGHLTRRQLRVYFAAHEMLERRRYTDRVNGPERPLYGTQELATLVGGRGSPRALADLNADIRRLAKIGLVRITPHSIEFAVSADQIGVEDLAGFWAMLEQIPNRRRMVPVPRRMLRALAAGFSRAVTGVVLAILIRSLYWHREGSGGVYRVDGRTKGSWIAEVFGISRRAVTEARTTLIELGWMEPLEAPQWAMNRWGSHDRINPGWAPPARGRQHPERRRVVGEGRRAHGGSASPRRGFSVGSASPDLNRSLSLPGNKNTRRPAPTRAGPAGASTRSGLGSRKKNIQSPSGSPNIRDIRTEDLADVGRLLELHRQAIAAGLAKAGEGGRLDFVAMAERARARARKPGAMFYWLLREGKSQFITQADEDEASRRLKQHLYGPARETRARQWGGPPKIEPPPGEEDRFVVACVRIAKQHRMDDPFGVARLKGWTRERWDATLADYEARQLQRWTPEPE